MAINGTGNGLNNHSADNTLKGGKGADNAYGGAGNDLYIVDNSAHAVVENPDEGVDSVLYESQVQQLVQARRRLGRLKGTSKNSRCRAVEEVPPDGTGRKAKIAY